MDRRSAFDVVCRGLGLWQVLYGVDFLAEYFNVLAGMYQPPREAPNAVAIQCLAHLLPGLFLLFSASTVVNMVYGAHAARGFVVEGVDEPEKGEAEPSR